MAQIKPKPVKRGKKKETPKQESDNFLNAPIELLVLSETDLQARRRKHLNTDNLKELTESVKSVGIINPITVRRIHNKFEIISGERRYKAAKKAGLKSVPVIIRDVTDEQILEVQVIENIQREDVHPMDEAFGYQELLKSGRYNEQKVAERFGKSLSYVHKRLRLNNLIPDVQKAFYDGEIFYVVALEFSRLADDQQKDMWKWWNNANEWQKNLSSLKDKIQRNYYLLLKDAPFNKRDKNLHPEAGSCNDCPFRSGFNKSLFDDITNDTCMKPDCYREKTRLHIEKKTAEAKEAGKDLIQVSTQWYKDKSFPEGAVLGNQYEVYDPEDENHKEEDFVDAVIVHTSSYEGDQLGKIVKIKMKSDEYEDEEENISEEEKLKLQKKREQDEFNKKVEIEVNRRIISSVLLQLKAEDVSEQFISYLSFLINESIFNDYDEEDALEYFGITGEIFEKEFSGKIQKYFSSLNHLKKYEFITVMILDRAGLLNHWNPGTEKNPIVIDYCNQYGINIKELRKQVRKELKTAAKNSPDTAQSEEETYQQDKALQEITEEE